MPSRTPQDVFPDVKALQKILPSHNELDAKTPVVIPMSSTLPGENPTLPRLTLDRMKALDIALRNSTSLLIGLADVNTAKLNVEQQKVPMRTTFTFDTTSQRVIVPGTQYDPMEMFDYNTAVTVSQTISTFGRVKWGVLQAKLVQKQSAQNYRSALFTLFSRVDTLYARAILALERVRIAAARLEQRETFLASSNRLFKAGIVAQYDVLQYRSARTQAQQSLEAEMNDAQQARIELLTQLGLRPDTPVDIIMPSLDFPPPPDSLEDGMRRALTQRPELAALRWAVGAAEAQIEVAARINTPTLGLSSTYEALPGNTYQLDNDWSVYLNLSITMGDGGAARIQRAIARQALAQVKQNLEQEGRQVGREVSAAYTRLVSLWQQRQTAKVTVTQAQEALEIAMLRYQEGVSSIVELLNSQDSYISSRQTLASITTEYFVALIEWRRATAEDWPVEIPPSFQVNWELPKNPAPPKSWEIPVESKP